VHAVRREGEAGVSGSHDGGEARVPSKLLFVALIVVGEVALVAAISGDLRPIINHRKEYTRAVIAVEVSYDAELRLLTTRCSIARRPVRRGRTLIPGRTSPY
jgi:hypothetical protein